MQHPLVKRRRFESTLGGLTNILWRTLGINLDLPALIRIGLIVLVLNNPRYARYGGSGMNFVNEYCLWKVNCIYSSHYYDYQYQESISRIFLFIFHLFSFQRWGVTSQRRQASGSLAMLLISPAACQGLTMPSI